MSYTVFTSNPAALIPQSGRTVNTFPSGLVRVDQTYIGRTSQATTHRATLAVGNDMPDGDSSPCIDGLKIFPEVQERRREDGFTEYIVSAYGRSKSTATIERGIKNFSRSQFSFFRGTAIAKVVTHTPPTLASFNFPTDAFDPVAAYYFSDSDGNFEADTITKVESASFYTRWSFNFGTTSLTWYFLSPGISFENDFYIPLPLSISRTNFGYWTEWVYAYG